jgi:hypothetical protein
MASTTPPVAAVAYRPSASAASVGERGVRGLPGVTQDVPHQEHQDSDGDTVERRLQARDRVPQPPDRQSEEDREPRDRAEQRDLNT